LSEDLYSDTGLFHEIAHGNKKAFSVFFGRHNHKLFLFVESIIHSRADAEEIVQETFLKIWQSAQLLRSVENPGAYTYTIARNKTINYMRGLARRRRFELEILANQTDVDENALNQLLGREFDSQLKTALQALPLQKQSVFTMSRDKGMSHDEIAQALGLSRSRVKNIIVEALKYLRYVINDQHTLLLTGFWLLAQAR